MCRTSQWNDGSLAQIRDLRDEGHSFDTIAGLLGKNASTVRKAINRADKKPPRGREIYRDPYVGYDPRPATMAHLRDILKAHGYNARWQSLNIGSDHLIRHVANRNEISVHGESSMASCVAFA